MDSPLGSDDAQSATVCFAAHFRPQAGAPSDRKGRAAFGAVYRRKNNENRVKSLDFPECVWYYGKAAYCGFQSSRVNGSPDDSESKEKAGRKHVCSY